MSPSVTFLRDGLATLPQELKDEVSDELGRLFRETLPSRHIDSAYRPPAHLFINRTIRESVADSHYGSTDFWTYDGPNNDLVWKWLCSLRVEDIVRIQHALPLNGQRCQFAAFQMKRVEIGGGEYNLSVRTRRTRYGEKLVWELRGLLLEKAGEEKAAPKG